MGHRHRAVCLIAVRAASMPDSALLKDLTNCASPETLLAAIFRHYPDLQPPTDVLTIARSVGIADVRDLEMETSLSMLTVDTASREAVIHCAPGLSAQRRRGVAAHQLGHFLLDPQNGHKQCGPREFAESRRDTPEHKQEMQANRFAAGLLMPKPLFVASMEALGKPAITHLPDLAAAFDVTLEAAVTRYADLTHTICAFLFVKNGVMRFARPSRFFPPLSIQSGDPAPQPVKGATPQDRIKWLAAEARDWIPMSRETRAPKLSMQILTKSNGFQLVMLFANAAAERRADEEAEKDATERVKFGQRR